MALPSLRPVDAAPGEKPGNRKAAKYPDFGLQ